MQSYCEMNMLTYTKVSNDDTKKRDLHNDRGIASVKKFYPRNMVMVSSTIFLICILIS
jgi:hypothetical protein